MTSLNKFNGDWIASYHDRVLFYHLERQPIERVLPTLIEKSLERGWRVVVQAASEERVEALDAQLWTFREDSFLPHGTWREAEAREQPVLLTVHDDNPNGAAVRFLVDGAPVPADAEAYARIVLIFDGNDPDAVALATRALERGQGEGVRGHLLADRRAGALAAQAMSCARSNREAGLDDSQAVLRRSCPTKNPGRCPGLCRGAGFSDQYLAMTATGAFPTAGGPQNPQPCVLMVRRARTKSPLAPRS